MNDELTSYILEEHTEQINSLRQRVHEISNALVKDQQLLENIIENNKKMLAQMELINIRVNKLEDVNKDRESKLSLLKKSIKYWPAALFIMMVLDYAKILAAGKSFLHLG